MFFISHISSKRLHKWLVAALCLWMFNACTCSFYKFSQVNIPPEIKTIFIEQFQSEVVNNNDINFLPLFRTEFIKLTTNRTRLVLVDNKQDADWVLEGALTKYNVEVSGLGSTQIDLNKGTPDVSQLNLKVSISARLLDNRDPTKLEEDVAKSKEFSAKDEIPVEANTDLNAIQNTYRSQIVQRLSQQLFEQVFSNW